MRILLIHQYFLGKTDAGSARFNEMTRVWADEGHEVTVISGMLHNDIKPERYKGKWFFHEADHSQNIDVHRCHVSENYNKSFMGRLWAYATFTFTSTWAGLFKTKGKYDVIIVTSPPLFVGIPAYLISRLKRIPLIFEIRDLWPESAVDTGVLVNKTAIRLAYWFEAFIYKKAKLINVLTPAFRETLITKKEISENKIIYIPNAADFSISEKVSDNFDATYQLQSVLFEPDGHVGASLVVDHTGADVTMVGGGFGNAPHQKLPWPDVPTTWLA